MSFLPLRLPAGADLREALEAAVLPAGAGGAFVASGIGSLSDPRVRLAAASTETALTGPFEIVALSGTIAHGQAHLHVVLADERGAVLGGHLLYGNRVRTTAEVLLIAVAGWQLSREHDPVTGFRELVVRPNGGNRDDT